MASAIAAILLLGFAPVAPEVEGRYSDRADLERRLGMSTTYDVTTGRLTLLGKGIRMVLVNGMDMMLVNDQVQPLGERFSVVNGSLSLPSAARRFLANRFDSPKKTEERTKPQASKKQAVGSFTVLIDPGHGGVHATNKGKSGLKEKDINLDVSLKLRDLLEAEGIRVVMTRDRDEHLSPDVEEDLDKRVAICNAIMPDLFISIHTNRAENSDARGFEIFVAREDSSTVRKEKLKEMDADELQKKNGGAAVRGKAESVRVGEKILDHYAKISKDLAQDIRAKFKGALETEDRGVKEAGYYVLKWSRSPAVLVELEFLSNGAGERELASGNHRGKLAGLLADAIVEWKREIGK